jgi:arabinofuranosyltransferase
VSGVWRGIPLSPQRPPRALLLALPALVLLAWLTAVIWHASIVIDQVRHFYLDDVQMISMRYARHLAEGQGLVWNPGERVEGYSNPGWVLVMWIIHLAGAPPAAAALWVKVVAAAAAVGILVGSLRLARVSGPVSLAGELTLLWGLAMSADVVFWAANGFETTLLTALFVWLLAHATRETLEYGAPRRSTIVAAGCLPVIRSDAYLLALAIVVVAVGLSHDARTAARRALLALAIPLAHLAARLAYYGDLVPNTFHLRYDNAADVGMEGARYIRSLLINYGPLITVAVAGTFATVNRTRSWLLAAVICVGTHSSLTGGDLYEHFRFFAPAVPVLLVVTVGSVESWARTSIWRRATGLAGILVLAIVSGDMLRPWPIDALRSWRGKPWQGAALGTMIERHSSPHATVAAVDVGAVGYFSRRRVIDITGRTDQFVARSRGRRGADPAWRKFDIEHSLAARPDIVITSAPDEAARLGEAMFALQGVDPDTQVIPALVSSPTFLRSYRDNVVPLPELLERNAIYLREDSPERLRVGRWRPPTMSF